MSGRYFSLIKEEIMYELESLNSNLRRFSKKHSSFVKEFSSSINNFQEIISEDLSFFKDATRETLDTWEQFIIFRHDHFSRVEHFFSTLRLGCSQFNPKSDFSLFDDEKKSFHAANLLAKKIWKCCDKDSFPGILIFGGEKYRTVPQFQLLTFPSVDERRFLYLGILGHEISHMIIVKNHMRDEYYDEKNLEPYRYLKHWNWELLADILGITVIGPILPYAFLVSGFPIVPLLTIESKHGGHFCSNILWHPPDEIRLPLQLKALEIQDISGKKQDSIINWIKIHHENMNSFLPEESKSEFRSFKDKLNHITEIYSTKIEDLCKEAKSIVKDPYTAEKHEAACDLADSLEKDFGGTEIPDDIDPRISLNALFMLKIRRTDLNHKQISDKFIESILHDKNKKG